jgi:putative transposase
MPRRRRSTTAGIIFHILNRGSRKGVLFETADDYRAFETVLGTAVERFGIQLLAYCLMPNHWHFVIVPPASRALSRFMHWLTTTHARRWRLHTGTHGQGAVYQGRFKAVPIESNEHLLWVLRYVERNACRASLVNRAEDWQWCSLWRRENHTDTSWLSSWPVAPPADWLDRVNDPQTPDELAVFRRQVQSGEPFGTREWRERVLTEMGRGPRRRRGRGSRETVHFK